MHSDVSLEARLLLLQHLIHNQLMERHKKAQLSVAVNSWKQSKIRRIIIQWTIRLTNQHLFNDQKILTKLLKVKLENSVTINDNLSEHMGWNLDNSVAHIENSVERTLWKVLSHFVIVNLMTDGFVHLNDRKCFWKYGAQYNTVCLGIKITSFSRMDSLTFCYSQRCAPHFCIFFSNICCFSIQPIIRVRVSWETYIQYLH